MASITIRNLPDQIKEKLRLQAARHGISLEAYVRKILQQASDASLSEQIDIVAIAQKYFGSKNGVDLELPPRQTKRGSVDFKI